MNKRVYIIAILGIVAIILTVIRESDLGPAENLSFSFTAKREISADRISEMSDNTLQSLGVIKKNIRPIKNRNDVRVLYHPQFDVLNFIGALKDSLQDYSAEIYSIENAKEKTSVVQIKNGDIIVISYIFSKDQNISPQKGVSPSAQKNSDRK